MSAEEIQKIVDRNRRVCLRFRFLQSIFLGGSLMVTYYLDLGLSQTQIFILQTVLGVVNVTADIPFGYLADRIGIRKVLIIGSMLLLVQSTYFMLCTTFWQFVLALVGTGLYLAALNNTTNAAMSLTYKMSPAYNPADYGRYLKRATRAGNLGYIAGMLGGGLLGSVGGMSWPFRLQPLVSVACLICAFGLVNPVLKPQHAGRDLIVKAIRMMLVDRRDIRYMIMMHSGFFLYIHLILWILQPRMQQAGIPVYAYSIVYVLWALAVMALARFAQDRSTDETQGLRVLLIVSMIVGGLAAGFTQGVAGFVALMIGLSLLSGFAHRLFDSFMDEVLPPEGLTRNTELAIGSTIPMLLFSVVAPFYGMLIDATSLGTALVIATMLCSVLTAAGYMFFRKEVKKKKR